AVDQAQFVDVGRDFRIVDRLQRADDIVGKPRQLFGRNRRGRSSLPVALHPGLRHVFVHHHHPKNVRAFSSASTSASTSALVLYMANEARHVEVTPNLFSSGWAQCVPARTATPERSMTIDTSCA